MAQLAYVCSNGHETKTYLPLDACPAYVRGRACNGEMLSAKTKRAQDILKARRDRSAS